MLKPRTLRIEPGKVTHSMCVVLTELTVHLNRNAPPGSVYFSVQCSPTVQYRIMPSVQTKEGVPSPLTKESVLLVTMSAASEQPNDSKLLVRFYGSKTETLATAVVHLTAVEISLDVDADRDGVVEKNNPNKASWQWGPNGHGAILLVNCDSDLGRGMPDSVRKDISKVSDVKDMSQMILRTKGPSELPDGYKLAMHINRSDGENIRVYRMRSQSSEKVQDQIKNFLYKAFVKSYPLVVSTQLLSNEVPYVGGVAETEFLVEGLRFPDRDFNGMVTINISLLESTRKGFPETPIFTDKVIFRVAPWIMTPNTLKPIEVFACSVKDNYQFLKGIKKVADLSGCKLKVIYEYMNRGDRWMQDELEFGYIDSPHHSFPVVLDSPRDRELQDFPYEVLLGPDFGYVTREPWNEEVSSLDSFGNLEVSPPVTVNGKSYPLGRIIIGVAFPTTTKGRDMTKVIQDFLWAQKVQEPIALYSDWLAVGHVDEFMTFVPAPDRKGFRLLLASPDAGYKVFQSLQQAGYGKNKMFEGLGENQEISVENILSDPELQKENDYVQSCIDWNRDVLKKELGLDEEDIIDLPILFKLVGENRAVAYYPDMVNMLVLGKHLGVPKPFGPRVNGRCMLEVEMERLMHPLGLQCTFIDDFATYHKLLGEVHCGSNVRRERFAFRWWHMER